MVDVLHSTQIEIRSIDKHAQIHIGQIIKFTVNRIEIETEAAAAATDANEKGQTSIYTHILWCVYASFAADYDKFNWIIVWI